MRTHFGNNLQTLRKRKLMSQELLAEDLGITRARIGSWEETRSEPPLYMLVKIAEYFSVTIELLLKNKIE